MNRNNSSRYAALARLMQDYNSEGQLPFVGWLSLALVGMLLAGAIIGCVASRVGDPQADATALGTATVLPPTTVPHAPIRAPTDTPAPTVALKATKTRMPTKMPSSTPAPTEAAECPTDPAEWTMIPYEMPGSDRTLCRIDPPCVMEQVEAKVGECLDASAEGGRNWSLHDDERCYSVSGFTKPLTGETMDEISGRTLICSEVVGGEFTTELAFYTAGEKGLVADVLIVTRPEQPSIHRRYNCETGEMVEETDHDGTKGFVAYWPVLYEHGRWRMGYQPDIYQEVDADTLDPHAMVDAVLVAQERQTRQP